MVESVGSQKVGSKHIFQVPVMLARCPRQKSLIANLPGKYGDWEEM